MAASIYDQHRAAFSNVSAFVVLKGDDKVATIAFKFPRDGAGRLYVYVHWIGDEMVRGFAGGWGYDKRSAACYSAMKRIAATGERAAFVKALRDGHDGAGWETCLRNAGFTVMQAV
jgi:hypothetical protein